jgi:TolA-binding protein
MSKLKKLLAVAVAAALSCCMCFAGCKGDSDTVGVNAEQNASVDTTAQTITELQNQIKQLQDEVDQLQINQQQNASSLSDINSRLQSVLLANAQLESGLYSIKDIYELGILTQDDLLNIAYLSYGSNEMNESLMDKDFVASSVGKLSDETELAIKQDYLKKYLADTAGATVNDVNIHEYYGTYNSCVVVVLTDNFSGWAGSVRDTKVGNVYIMESAGYLLVWVG